MTLSIAVLGCGAIAHTHAETLARVAPEVRLAFASRAADRAEAYRHRHRGFAAFGDYPAAIADQRVSAVLVTTPPARHLALTLEALEAGKHVIVEKPAFLRAADADAVATLTRRTGRQVLVAENYRYKPLTAALLGLIDRGVIGTPRLIRLTALKYQPANDWRGSPALAGGGALFEGGIHWVNLLATLGGDIADVRGVRPSGGAEPERTMVVVVRFASGAVGTLHHSWEARARLKGLSISQIVGERGSVAFESNGLFVAVNAAKQRLLLPGFRDLRGFRAMWRDFVNSLRTDTPAVMTLADARRDLAVVEAAYRTATQG